VHGEPAPRTTCAAPVYSMGVAHGVKLAHSATDKPSRHQGALAGGRRLLARRGRGAALQGARAAAGTSAFAYQGTNAHAVLGAPEPGARRLAAQGALPWRRRRFWWQARARCCSCLAWPEPGGLRLRSMPSFDHACHRAGCIHPEAMAVMRAHAP